MTRQPVETAAVLLARPAWLADGGLRLLGVELHPAAEQAYRHRDDRSLVVGSEGYMPALKDAETHRCVPIWVHTHPGEAASPRPSPHDRRVDEQLMPVFTTRSESGLYGSLITSMRAGQLSFTGRLEGTTTTNIDRIVIPADRFEVLRADDVRYPPLPSLHDRHVRAFGPDIPRVLGDLRVALIGCGGTGSAVAEQLVRLGVRNFVLVDPDKLCDTNTTRVYGSTLRDVDRFKVEVLGNHLRDIAPDAVVECIEGSVCQREIAERIVGADVVFGCTDDEAGRMRLSRFAYAYLTLVIDCGVKISSDGAGRVDDITGRVTILDSRSACLLCRGRVRPEVAAAEEMSPEEYQRRRRDGYVPDLGGTEPAVVAFTTAVAAAAVNELLERLVGYGVESRPSEILLRIHDRAISTNHQHPTPDCYCGTRTPSNFGDTARYWGLGWAS
ncbi:hypothetical protein AU194_08205 [Mycobacterium sp. GA-2829]|nr:hypothetical protein AU194_08205 [Mycobacterium sp. GA-2829]